jgi:hypothetical protein
MLAARGLFRTSRCAVDTTITLEITAALTAHRINKQRDKGAII